MKLPLSHSDWVMRVKAALTTCGLIFFGCGGVAVDDSLTSDAAGESSDEYQRDIIRWTEPSDPEPDVEVWLSDDTTEAEQPGGPDRMSQPGAEGSPCDCRPGQYGISITSFAEPLIFTQPLEETGAPVQCGLPGASLDSCGQPLELGACDEQAGCVLFTNSRAGSPALYRWVEGVEGVNVLMGESLEFTVKEDGGAVLGELSFNTGAEVYQGTYRFCAPDRSVCEP